MPKYLLRCGLCGAEYEPDPFRLQCDVEHEPALLRTVYQTQKLEVQRHLPGLFQFMNWLPTERSLAGAGKPVTYESRNLAHHLGLNHLLISFNGYFPEQGAQLRTCSFKELEAYSVLSGLPDGYPRTLVIASAGNTGRAFAEVGSRHGIPLCLVIPEQSLSAIWLRHRLDSRVCLVAVTADGDYADAIALSRLISGMEGFFPEGGAANVARRDSMGLTVLDAAVTLGRIPDHYFQAVGSGTGGISAWEANLRLLGDGRFGNRRMKLHLAQNWPFTPMVDAWKAGSRTLQALDESVAKKQIGQVAAQVLTNRQPAYSLAGGIYEALVDTQGEMYSVTNQEAEQARRLFETLEGIDISPAAGVAVASLIQAVAAGKVNKRDFILVNITSGGFKRIQQDYPLQYPQPSMVYSPAEINWDTVVKRMNRFIKPSTFV